ncbi:hypothetical protein MMMB2_4763 [Mycobacterium marinum MB2]|nr:hypothetical protein MMMB2_4763 [Mycobacterium marinum MB2]
MRRSRTSSAFRGRSIAVTTRGGPHCAESCAPRWIPARTRCTPRFRSPTSSPTGKDGRWGGYRPASIPTTCNAMATTRSSDFSRASRIRPSHRRC